MSRDETLYPDPEDFKPERFMVGEDEAPVDPEIYIFGFGRRSTI